MKQKKKKKTLRGLGIATSPKRSSALLSWKNSEDQQGTFQPYVLEHLSVNLYGRDVLTQMELKLMTEGYYGSEAQAIMLKQGHIWGKGLGRHNRNYSTH